MRRLVLALLLMLLAAGLLWGGFSWWVLSGDNYQRVFPDLVLEPNELDWQILKGQGAVADEGFAILDVNQHARARIGVSLPDSIEAARYERIEARMDPDMGHRIIQLFWSETASFVNMRSGSLESERPGVVGVDVTYLPRWEGEINYLAVEFFGRFDEPGNVYQIRLYPARPDFVTLQSRLLADWFGSTTWSQRNLNFTFSTEAGAALSPLIATAVWVGLSLILIALVAWRRPALRVMLVLPLITGWLLLDLRWQVDLLSKASDTWHDFAGKDWQERRAADIDGDLFEWIERLRAEVGPGPQRVFALGYSDYWTTRARYHAQSWSVRTEEDLLEPELVRHFRSGDLLMLLVAPRIQVAEIQSTVADADDESLLELQSVEEIGGWPIVEAKDGGEMRSPGMLVRGFYRAEFEVDQGSLEAPVHVHARLVGEEGSVMLALREFAPEDIEDGRVSISFALPQEGEIEFSMATVSEGDVEPSAVRLEMLDDEGLVYLYSNSDGPYVTARRISRQRDMMAMEVL